MMLQDRLLFTLFLSLFTQCASTDLNNACPSVNCDFESKDKCGWSSKGGNNYTLKWKFDETLVLNNLAHLHMNGEPEGSKGRLSSVMLSRQPGYDCHLSFRYSIAVTGCTLTLVQEGTEQNTSNPNQKVLWFNSTSTGSFLRSWSPVSVKVDCQWYKYQLHFVGERTAACQFGVISVYDGNDVDDISCTAIPTKAPTILTSQATQQASTETASSSKPQETFTQTDSSWTIIVPTAQTFSDHSFTSEGTSVSSSHLREANALRSAGAVAGIVAAVSMISLVVVVAVYCLLRRRKQRKIETRASQSPLYENK